MRAYSGTICPVLVGFATAVIVTLVTTETARQPVLGFLAIPAFTSVVALLLYAMQYGAIALMYTASPADHFDWVPEAREADEALIERQREQKRDLFMRVQYEGRMAILYDLGLIAFLFGCVCLVVPRDLDVGRIGATVVLGVATLLEVTWAISTRTKNLEWLVPTSPRIED